MSIVIDFAHLWHRYIFASQKMVIENPPIAAHLVMNGLFSITEKFEVTSDNPIIIALDAPRKNNWRTKYYEKNVGKFPAYKGMSYKGNRIKNEHIPWNTLFEIFDDIKKVLETGTDVQVVEHPEAEADDIIYVIAKLNEAKRKYTTIISSDSDFRQLTSDYTKQFDPLKQKIITDFTYDKVSLENKEELLEMYILTGQKRKDNILPVVKGMGPKTALPIVKQIGPYLETANKSFKARYKFNKKMIDLTQVPQHIEEDITETLAEKYNNYNFNIMLEFCRKYHLNKLAEKIDTLHFNKTVNLYDI